MRNTTKLKHILQLYVVNIDMDDEEIFHLTLVNKRSHTSATFLDKKYSIVMEKAFSYMKKGLK